MVYTLNHAEMQDWMRYALTLAQNALPHDVPVGAVFLDAEGKCIAEGVNTREKDNNPLGHAELNAMLEVAQRQGDWRLNELTLIVTLEPCAMCANALKQARIGQVVFGAYDLTEGEAPSKVLQSDGGVLKVIGGILEEEAKETLKTYFKSKRGMP
ncbi:MAG: nucleoside deaminase [Vampirovibrionales bacterium]